MHVLDDGAALPSPTNGGARHRLFDEASATFPGVQIDFKTFCFQLDRLGYHGSLPKYGQAVYLCTACGLGLAAALKVLEESYFPKLAKVVRRLDTRREIVDEALQRVRERLFVGPSRKILSYRGDGSLAGWLGVIAANTARDYLRESRSEKCGVYVNTLAARYCSDPTLADDVELGEQEDRSLRSALIKSVAVLEREELRLLYLYFVDALTIDDLSRASSVHRSTIARRIRRCLDRIRSCLARELRVSRVGLCHTNVRGLSLCFDELMALGLAGSAVDAEGCQWSDSAHFISSITECKPAPRVTRSRPGKRRALVGDCNLV